MWGEFLWHDAVSISPVHHFISKYSTPALMMVMMKGDFAQKNIGQVQSRLHWLIRCKLIQRDDDLIARRPWNLDCSWKFDDQCQACVIPSVFSGVYSRVCITLSHIMMEGSVIMLLTLTLSENPRPGFLSTQQASQQWTTYFRTKRAQIQSDPPLRMWIV